MSTDDDRFNYQGKSYDSFGNEITESKIEEIKSVGQRVKLEEVPVKTMDVQAHINERLKRAREVTAAASKNTTDIDIDTSSLAGALKQEEKQEAKPQVQNSEQQIEQQIIQEEIQNKKENSLVRRMIRSFTEPRN